MRWRNLKTNLKSIHPQLKGSYSLSFSVPLQDTLGVSQFFQIVFSNLLRQIITKEWWILFCCSHNVVGVESGKKSGMDNYRITTKLNTSMIHFGLFNNLIYSFLIFSFSFLLHKNLEWIIKLKAFTNQKPRVISAVTYVHHSIQCLCYKSSCHFTQ